MSALAQVLMLLAFLALHAQMFAGEPASLDAQATLAKLIPRLRAEKNLIGLAAIVWVDGKPIAAAVDGERQKGSGTALAVGDKFHLGSITKSITATMIARLVEQKTLAWNTTVGDCIGDVLAVHDDWRGVTLEQLLTHTSGAPANFSVWTQFKRPAEGPERIKQRREIVAQLLAEEPAGEPGTKFLYSNVGFTIAGAMAEHKTGKSWEDLVRQEVFMLLGLADAGFGPPHDDPGAELSQPRGHSKLGPLKFAVGVDDDNSPLIGPAGIVHMTLDDLCRYGNEHLAGERGEGVLLSAESYQRIHTPKLNNYACGWVIQPAKDGASRQIWHNGSNTMWYALVVLLPERNAVAAVAANDGDIGGAEEAAREIVRECEATLE